MSRALARGVGDSLLVPWGETAVKLKSAILGASAGFDVIPRNDAWNVDRNGQRLAGDLDFFFLDRRRWRRLFTLEAKLLHPAQALKVLAFQERDKPQEL